MKAGKYHSRKTEVDGITFDSRSEAAYYLVLKAQRDAHTIKGFDLQPRFVLQESFRKCPACYHVQPAGSKCDKCQTKTTLHRPMVYVSDFLIWPKQGRPIVCDVKGKYMTDVFKMKQKLFEKRYPCLTITIQIMPAIKPARRGKK